MSKVLVTYYTRTGNTKRMAEAVAENLENRGVEVSLLPVEDVEVDSLLEYDGYLVGSPNYFGTMAYPVKKLIDESVKHFKKLEGKLVGAFTSEGMIGGGGDAVVLDILKAFLIHGCVVQGLCSAGHYGPVAVGAPDERVADEIGILCAQFVKLMNKL